MFLKVNLRNSSSVYPSVLQKASFALMKCLSGPDVAIPIGALATIALDLFSLSLSASSAFLRSVISMAKPLRPTVRLATTMGLLTIMVWNVLPSFLTKVYSFSEEGLFDKVLLKCSFAFSLSFFSTKSKTQTPLAKSCFV